MKKKILITALLAFTGLVSNAQTVKQPNTPQKEVKAVDSTKITITVTLEQYNQIQAILTQASNLIGQSNLPIKQANETINGLVAVSTFFKKYEPQPKKEK